MLNSHLLATLSVYVRTGTNKEGGKEEGGRRADEGG